ncbi:MAG TPA: carboxypeptidase regulatory-like domain-containing protein [Verrucomicrobiae bacterium]
MKLNRRFMAFAALVASLQLVSAGDVTGKITLKGTPPPEKDIPVDPACGKIHPTKKTRLYVVGSGGELADTFIYVKDGLTGKTFPVPEKGHLIDQVGCEYTPYVSGAMANQKILVRNSDPLLHNVHPIPTVAGNKEANIAQMPKSKDLEFTFAKEEPFLRFKCDVHPWMFSYVSIMNHPFYATSGKDGTFKITGLPAGKYTIEANHRKAGKQTVEVEVPESGSKEANFTLEAK